MRPDRESWASALASADAAKVAALADRIRDRATVTPLAPPREGLMLMQARDSVAGAAFHLGEIPMARVHLRLTAPEGGAEGGAALIGKSVFDCHPEPARTRTVELYERRQPNHYTIRKDGRRKIIHQMPWYRGGAFAGFIEISIPIPDEMPHFERDAS